MTPEHGPLAGEESAGKTACQSDTWKADTWKVWRSIVPDGVLVADPASVELDPDPIRGDWILSGAPQAASKILARSRDWLSILVVWECGAGRFKWHYTREETLVVVSGGASVLDERGVERHFGAGDVVSFPDGTSCIWTIEDRIRKIALVRETVWAPLGMAAKTCKKVARTLTLGRGGI